MKPLKEIRKTKAAQEDDLLSRPGVTGVDIGPKISKGKKTEELSIRVYVAQKKSVPAKEKIQPEIDGIKTDIIERKFVLHQRAIPVTDLKPKADTGTYDPLLGGISIGPCRAIGGYIYTGTLGCLVKDRDTNEKLMLSNYHVLAEKWDEGDTICQPSRVDGGSCPADTIGSLVRSVLSENVDGAVARITHRGNQCDITEIGKVRGKANATVGMAVRKRGRTTGLTYGTVDSIDLSVNVEYDDGNHVLRNQIGIDVDESQSTQFGNSGDSGSVVVDSNEKVIGLYFAGTSDGSFGVANPIDVVLDELNVDLCVTPIFKNIQDEKGLGDVFKWWLRDKHYKEFIKEHMKEHMYEKPPYSEHKYFENPLIDNPIWDRPYRYDAAGQMPGYMSEQTNQMPSSSLEARLANIEAMLFSQQTGAESTLQPQVGPMRCADFTSAATGLGPNPTTVNGATFTVHDYGGAASANTRVDEWGGFRGLNAGYRTEITFSRCDEVTLTLLHFNPAGATATAYDASGSVVSVASTTSTQRVDQLLTLSGGGIVRVDVDCRQNEVFIRKFCHCGLIKKAEWKEKMEPKELKEWKEKPEFKEWKEKPEPKEFKDGKEKPEPKELKEKPEPKELKEKPESKEFKEKELEPKQIREPKQIQEPKQIREPKQIFEPKQIMEPKQYFEPKQIREGFDIPYLPWQEQQAVQGGGCADGQCGGNSLEERLARIEAALSGGQQHFIGSELRPDLSHGSLQNEPDMKRRR